VLEVSREKGVVNGERIITEGTLVEVNVSLDSMVARDVVQDDSTIELHQGMISPFSTRKLTNKTHVNTTKVLYIINFNKHFFISHVRG